MEGRLPQGLELNSGYVLTSWVLGGTVVGASIALALYPFATHGNWIDLFGILTVAGHGVGWIVGFLKLGGELP